MKLIIMRHGQAAWSAPSDAQRPLTDYGRQEVRHTIEQMAELGVDRIVASPYLRAQQTAGIAAEVLKLPVDTLEGITPDDSPVTALDLLPDSGTVLVVSHMPLVGCLTSLLCDGSVFGAPGFATANAAVLEMELPGPGLATLERFLPQ